jgi:iron complex transport system ATP-binding protein
MTPPLIEARGLSIGHGVTAIGHDLNLAASAGRVLCLLGPNGSGKTTLFKTLLGLLPPRAGAVLLRGDVISTLKRDEIARRVAYVPQAHAAHFPFAVSDMVVMGRTAHQGVFAMPSAEDRTKAAAALARLGIADLADRDYTRLSGGQRQLVLIARALAQDAPAIVMDEPTASLDFGNQVLVLREIAGLARAGLAIVLSTHDPDHAFSIGDDVALLHEGSIMATGRPNDVLTPERLQRVYGVAVRVAQLPGGQTVCVPG